MFLALIVTFVASNAVMDGLKLIVRLPFVLATVLEMALALRLILAFATLDGLVALVKQPSVRTSRAV
jgi:hypothetical protein